MTTPKNRYDILFPEAKLGNVLLGGKLLKSPLGRYPCDVCHQHTEWFRRDLNARICSEQCADKVIGERPEEKQEKLLACAKRINADVVDQLRHDLENPPVPPPKVYARIDDQTIITMIEGFREDDRRALKSAGPTEYAGDTISATKDLLDHIAAEMQARKEPA